MLAVGFWAVVLLVVAADEDCSLLVVNSTMGYRMYAKDGFCAPEVGDSGTCLFDNWLEFEGDYACVDVGVALQTTISFERLAKASSQMFRNQGLGNSVGQSSKEHQPRSQFCTFEMISLSSQLEVKPQAR